MTAWEEVIVFAVFNFPSALRRLQRKTFNSV